MCWLTQRNGSKSKPSHWGILKTRIPSPSSFWTFAWVETVKGHIWPRTPCRWAWARTRGNCPTGILSSGQELCSLTWPETPATSAWGSSWGHCSRGWCCSSLASGSYWHWAVAVGSGQSWSWKAPRKWTPLFRRCQRGEAHCCLLHKAAARPQSCFGWCPLFWCTKQFDSNFIQSPPPLVVSTKNFKVVDTTLEDVHFLWCANFKAMHKLRTPLLQQHLLLSLSWAHSRLF